MTRCQYSVANAMSVPQTEKSMVHTPRRNVRDVLSPMKPITMPEKVKITTKMGPARTWRSISTVIGLVRWLRYFDHFHVAAFEQLKLSIEKKNEMISFVAPIN